MFKIGEFSGLTRVSVRMLRYYDEQGLLAPAQIDPSTGYRYYAAGQIPRLNKIIFLRDSGFTVAEIAAALRDWNDACVLQQLEAKQRELERAIRDQQQRLDRISLAKQAIGQTTADMHYNVSLKSVPSQLVLSLRRVIPDYYAEGALWAELSRFTRQQGITLSENTFSIYHDPDYREADVDVELCAPVAAAGEDQGGFVFRRTEPVPHMACIMVYGGFEHIAGAYRSLAAWLPENGRYQPLGQSRQIVHRGPWNEPDPAQYLTEVQIPVTVAAL